MAETTFNAYCISANGNGIPDLETTACLTEESRTVEKCFLVLYSSVAYFSLNIILKFVALLLQALLDYE